MFWYSENPNLCPVLDRLLEAAQNSRDVQKFAESRFVGFEELIENIGEGSLEKAVREFLEKFGSKLPIN